jgi:DNA helicase-2/ATP-dependent DNA helicase PcrA
VRTKIYGPPGTGKTDTLLRILERELETVDPSRVAFLTFTRAAKAEALGRTGRPEKDFPFLSTIHSLCYRRIGAKQDRMVKPKDLRRFGDKIGVEITGFEVDLDAVAQGERRSDADVLLQLNHLGRHRKVGLKGVLADNFNLSWQFSKWFTQAYREWKDSEDLLDYTDLLSEYLQYGRPLDVEVMIVDESQDLSALQWDVVRKAGQKAARTYYAGDDDQAIFQWAGASADTFNSEPADEDVVLGQSYRLPRSVHRVAGGIIAQVQSRKTKEFKPRDCDGLVQQVGYLHESLLDGPDTLVLFRNHYRGRRLAEQLSQLNVEWEGFMSPSKGKSFPLKLMSIHQSKGREAHTVVLDTEMAKRTAAGFDQDPDQEHRVWYVATTRAKERLFILTPEGSRSYII